MMAIGWKNKIIYGLSYFAAILFSYLGFIGIAAFFEKELGFAALGALALSISGIGIYILNKRIFNRYQVSRVYSILLLILAFVATFTVAIYLEGTAT